MKILHTVESYFPSIGGMQEVAKQLSERLVQLGHDVTIATRKHTDRNFTLLNGVTIKEFAISGNMVNGYVAESSEINYYQDFIVNSNFDIIVNFAAQQWATDLCLPILEKINSKKVFVPTGFSALYNQQFFDYFEKMKDWMKLYDYNIFLSNNYRDINFARLNGVTEDKIIIIPNGASADEFLFTKTIDFRKKYKIQNKDFLILLVGSHTGLKGHIEAIKIFKKANIRDSVFCIIGNYHFNGHKNDTKNKISLLRTFYRIIKKIIKIVLFKNKKTCPNFCKKADSRFNKNLFNKIKNKKILILDIPRNETIAAYKVADLFLFPSNIECSPIVLFECMAAKTPFITSDVGNAKEIIEWSSAGVLMPTRKNTHSYGTSHVDIKSSVKLFEQLYTDTDARKKLADNGFKVWQERFSWEVITKKYENLYFKIVNKG